MHSNSSPEIKHALESLIRREKLTKNKEEEEEALTGRGARDCISHQKERISKLLLIKEIDIKKNKKVAGRFVYQSKKHSAYLNLGLKIEHQLFKNSIDL